MRTVYLIVVICFVTHSKALECEIGKVKGDDIKNTLSLCVKNNETLEKIWEMASSSSTPSPDSDSSSMEDEEETKVQADRMRRVVKRASNIEAKTVLPPTGNHEEKSTVPPEETTESNNDACIVQCVFRELGLTDENGLPDRTKIVNSLMKHATGRELQIFLQEAAGECFQQMDTENNTDPCTYSTQLVTCLANKGRMNCADWPAGSLPF